MITKHNEKTLDESIRELEEKITRDPNPYYLSLVDRLKKIRDEPEHRRKKGGFKGYGVS